MRRAQCRLPAAKADLVLFLDNDVVLLEGCVERLIEALASIQTR